MNNFKMEKKDSLANISWFKTGKQTAQAKEVF